MAEIGESLETKGQKMEVDYSATVDKKIPQCEALAAVSWHFVSDCAKNKALAVGKMRNCGVRNAEGKMRNGMCGKSLRNGG